MGLYEELQALREVYMPQAAPNYDPDSYTQHHNCYAYALRLKKHGWATPGQLLKVESKDIDPSEITKNEIKRRLEDIDGLLPIYKHGARRDAHIIAAFVMPQEDFHFASFNSDGYWSSKWSKNPVTRTETPFDELDTNFLIGYYEVPETGVTYYPRLEVIEKLKEFGL